MLKKALDKETGSAVISGVAENADPSTAVRFPLMLMLLRKFYCFSQFNVYLSLSFAWRQLLSHASMLKHFSIKGIYIRPSLTKAERDCLWALRATRPNAVNPNPPIVQKSYATPTDDHSVNISSPSEDVPSNVIASDDNQTSLNN
ncbi:unnamed protein product [Haemonchus placei]|uniref:Uncharacterized protein n=1 Tax=Haemonchus placei TaxID=6290 RepID=A0A3P7VXQ5_HAEPC|nr:unnamed protein product [Haemonchus placei]